MAIYHLKVKPVSRAGGRSSTAASAYRAAEIVYDQTTGQTFDYTRKRGVEHAEIVLPTEAVQRDINWAREREALWNAAEIAERRSNSRVAREYEIALPHELNAAQREDLSRTFAQQIADRFGCAVDFAIHEPHRNGDERNYHAHLLATTRVIEPGGLGEKTAIEWSDTDRRKAGLVNGADEIAQIREAWAGLANERLQELGLEARIDHRTLEEQGIDRQPTVHLGPAVSAMERRGIRTEVGKRLEVEALEAVQQRIEKAAELGKLEREGHEIGRSILDLSGNIEDAKRIRDLELAKGGELGMGFGRKPTIEELQKQGREQWLAMRNEQKAKERAPAVEKGPEKSIEQAPEQAKALSLTELREKAIEEWREYRRVQGLEKAHGPARSQELEIRKGREPTLEQSPGKSKGIDGPEID
jgi:ATP-dependent exoDNAse (exonuclease V) alpha subunit